MRSKLQVYAGGEHGRRNSYEYFLSGTGIRRNQPRSLSRIHRRRLLVQREGVVEALGPPHPEDAAGGESPRAEEDHRDRNCRKQGTRCLAVHPAGGGINPDSGSGHRGDRVRGQEVQGRQSREGEETTKPEKGGGTAQRPTTAVYGFRCGR